VSEFDDMHTSRADYAASDGLHLRPRVESEAPATTLFDAIYKMSFMQALHEHVRCQSEHEEWQRKRGHGDQYAEAGRDLQAKSARSAAGAQMAARACGRRLRASGIEPTRMVTLVKEVVQPMLDETTLDRPDELRTRIMTWAIEGYYAAD